MNKILWLAVIVIALMIASSAFFYSAMPDPMISHWGINNKPDGYSSKAFFFVLFNCLAIGVFLLFLALPKIDPLRMKYAEFQKEYDLFILFFTCFLYYLFLIVIAANLGYMLNMGFLVLIAIAALFYFLGLLMQKVKRNWFIGIRTPWTLSSDSVWQKTHALSAKAFKVLAILLVITAVFSVFFAELAFPALLIEIIGFALLPVFYSYFEYQKEQKSKAKKHGKWKKHTAKK